MQIKTIFQKQISEFHLEGAADSNLLGRKAKRLVWELYLHSKHSAFT